MNVKKKLQQQQQKRVNESAVWITVKELKQLVRESCKCELEEQVDVCEMCEKPISECEC